MASIVEVRGKSRHFTPRSRLDHHGKVRVFKAVRVSVEGHWEYVKGKLLYLQHSNGNVFKRMLRGRLINACPYPRPLDA